MEEVWRKYVEHPGGAGDQVEVQLPFGSESQEVNVFIVLLTLPLTPSNLAA